MTDFVWCNECGRVVAAQFGRGDKATSHKRLIGWDEHGLPEYLESDERCFGSGEVGQQIGPEYEVWQSPVGTLAWERKQ